MRNAILNINISREGAMRVRLELSDPHFLYLCKSCTKFASRLKPLDGNPAGHSYQGVYIVGSARAHLGDHITEIHLRSPDPRNPLLQ